MGEWEKSEKKKKISANLRIFTLIRFSPSFVNTYLSLIRYWIIISCTHHASYEIAKNAKVETCLSTIFVYFSCCYTSRNTWDSFLSFSVSFFAALTSPSSHWAELSHSSFFLAVHLTHSTLRCLMSISVMTNERWKISFSSTFFSDANLSVFL